MTKKLLSILIVAASQISGCSSNDIDEQVCFDDSGEQIDCRYVSKNLRLNSTMQNSEFVAIKNQDPTLFKTAINFQLLKEYVEQMAMNLRESSSSDSYMAPIAVTSFVSLDSTLQNTDVLGNQISEYFISEMQNVGFIVSDYKVTGYIEVTEGGDLAMSRNLKNLKQDLNIGYVLTGTMVENQNGMIVNARLVSLSSNRVVASTSKLIPEIAIPNGLN